MNIHPEHCLKQQIRNIHAGGRCNNRAFAENARSIDDPIVQKIWEETQDNYLFRIYLLRMVGEITMDDCYADMETWNKRMNLALDDLRGFCWCCALRIEGKKCHHPQKPKCEWWVWDGPRRLKEMEDAE